MKSSTLPIICKTFHTLSLCVAATLLLSGVMVSRSYAAIADGISAIQAQLPPPATIKTATHAQLLEALRNAAANDPDRSLDIAAAVTQERWDLLNGIAPASDGKAILDGKTIVDSKSVVPQECGPICGPLRDMAFAIVDGADRSSDPAFIAAVIQAMLYSIPADNVGIGAQLVECIMDALPDPMASQVGTAIGDLRGVPVYQYTTPPGAVPPPVTKKKKPTTPGKVHPKPVTPVKNV